MNKGNEMNEAIGKNIFTPGNYYIKETDWKCLSKRLVLSEEFIEKFQDEVDWTEISYFQELSDYFIRNFQNRINWKELSRQRQYLSEEFIERF